MVDQNTINRLQKEIDDMITDHDRMMEENPNIFVRKIQQLERKIKKKQKEHTIAIQKMDVGGSFKPIKSDIDDTDDTYVKNLSTEQI